jgi:hypothetical protein
LTVLGPAKGRAKRRTVLLNQAIDQEDLEGAYSCVKLRYDLSRVNSAAMTGLLSVRSSPGCLEAGIDVARVRRHTNAYLTASGAKPQDIESWGESITGLATLQDNIARLGGDAIGAPTGRLDTWVEFGSAAAELKRQGFKALVWLELYCSRRDAGWDYTFVARQIDLGKLLNQARNLVTGIDLEGVVASEIEVVSDRRQLAKGIEAPLARLRDIPYVHLADIRTQSSYHDYIGVDLDGSFPQNTRAATRWSAIRACCRTMKPSPPAARSTPPES